MIWFIIIQFILAVASGCCTYYLWKRTRPADKFMICTVWFFTIMLGMFTGYIEGVYEGQATLLKTRQSLFTPEIKITKHPRFPRILSLATIDTVYEAHLDYRALAMPLSSPKFFTHKQDTLWQTAIFSYTKH